MLGFGDRFEEIEANYAAAERSLGRLIKATPSSKVVGDLALALVGAGISAEEFSADPATRPADGRNRCGPWRWRAVAAPSRSRNPRMRTKPYWPSPAANGRRR